MKYLASSPKNAKGQALIEYALILVLVALVTVVILAVFGPAIGKSYSNVVTGLSQSDNPANTSAPPTAVPTSMPTPTPDWVFCSDEYHYCSFSGTKQVRYGASGTYTIMSLTGGTMCNNSVFGDPLVGTLKHCYIR